MREERIAVFPGSFDPVTLGHMDIIRRASRLFDRVYVCAMVNGEKHGMFPMEQRLTMLRRSTAELDNVTAELWSGLLTDYAREKGAKYLVKGVRNGTDFDLEHSLADINRGIDAELETVLFCAEPTLAHFSSTMAREMIKYHQRLENYLPAAAAEFITKDGK